MSGGLHFKRLLLTLASSFESLLKRRLRLLPLEVAAVDVARFWLSQEHISTVLEAAEVPGSSSSS